MRYAFKKKIIVFGVVVIALMIFLHPDMNARRSYEYIEKDSILDYLHEETAENFTSSAVIDCDYRDVINDDTTLSISLVDGDLVEGHRIREGGEYSPQDCKPKFSTAIIVPYSCAIDLDTIHAVHDHVMDFFASRFHTDYRFVLPYLNLFGGVIAMLAKQYQVINGMSNGYFGWGGEDDDLYSRIEAYDLKLCRFEPDTSQYHMFNHRSQLKGERKSNLITDAKTRIAADGLSSLKYTEVATVLHPLFTHIMVDL